ncbi:MAG TPA: O-antigen ligase family protein [Solirubrobacteraceae bacterium]|nr:O-antigen ligase family protein [Solirubrobacteraceae bacterium]
MSATGLATSLPSAGTLALAAADALLVLAALVALMRRHAEAFPLLVILTLPFRVPIATDGRTVNLLVPLYLVVAAGAVAHLLPRWLALARWLTRERSRPPEGTGAEPRPRLSSASSWLTPRALEWALLAAVVLYALQASYSADRLKALENLAFFYVPFGLMFLVLRDVRWTRALLARCLGLAVALALIFASVGFVEYARKSVFLNPKVVVANEYDNYFRVNSVFFDPSIYGRFLAMVMIAVTAFVLSPRGAADLSPRDASAPRGAGEGPADARRAWLRGRRGTLAGALVLLWLLAGLVTSFSQSSIAALLLGMAALAAWCWGWRPTLAVTGALLALALAFVLLAPASLHFGLKGSKGSTANATSGRTTLVSGGLELFAQRPLEGYGAGSFETEYKRHSGGDVENATTASHTIPVTIAAEQGIVGLAVYVALLASAFAVLFRGAGRAPPRIAVAACFAALVLHTWTYADFLEDPTTWLLLALGVTLARAGASDARRGAGADGQAPHALSAGAASQ